MLLATLTILLCVWRYLPFPFPGSFFYLILSQVCRYPPTSEATSRVELRLYLHSSSFLHSWNSKRWSQGSGEFSSTRQVLSTKQLSISLTVLGQSPQTEFDTCSDTYCHSTCDSCKEYPCFMEIQIFTIMWLCVCELLCEYIYVGIWCNGRKKIEKFLGQWFFRQEPWLIL